jgi:hypothetical protein
MNMSVFVFADVGGTDTMEQLLHGNNYGDSIFDKHLKNGRDEDMAELSLSLLTKRCFI